MSEPAGTLATLTLHVTDSREAIIARHAAGLAHVMHRRMKRFRLIVGAGAVVGIVLAALSPPVGLALLAWSIFTLIATSQRLAQRRVANTFRRIPYACHPFTLTADAEALAVTAPQYSSRWSWSCFTEILDHDDGLLLVFAGTASVIALPPSAFADEPARLQAKELIEGWIAGAG